MARFPRRARLLKPSDFDRVFKAGRRLTVPSFQAVVAPSELGPRLGMAISRKQAPRAVDRNRIKRQIRASFRENQIRLPACDLVIMAKPSARELTSAAVAAELNQLWTRVQQRWSASSSS